MSPTPDSIAHQLQQSRQQQRYRSRQRVTAVNGHRVVVNGQPLLNFCSNDYLGLSHHPQLIAAEQQGAARFGAGSGASHLISGHNHDHHRLEQALADLTGQEAALLFANGYMANLALLTTFSDRHDTLYCDKLNHASLIDGARLSRAKIKRYPHRDMATLSRLLEQSRQGSATIATDSIFSMDGTLAPLDQLYALTDPESTPSPRWLIIDDAHAFAVLGPRGEGSLAHFGLPPRDNVIQMGTLGKGAGVYGAFVAGSQQVVERLIQRGRSYIYTTALPPAIAAGLRQSIALIESEEGAIRRQQLHHHIDHFRTLSQQLSLPISDSMSAIQPLLTGSETNALSWSAQLQQRGFWVSAIRPPTVPEGGSRLRITLSASHTTADIEALVAALAETITPYI
ncbi:8-amino-7-oxononanoate synthase [Ectothiorhodospiraceae bacterium BW-2]|nr:8-amino-7-oxononanoate synthase [Ectothiorhodospiraceae bacterium BW-2]